MRPIILYALAVSCVQLSGCASTGSSESLAVDQMASDLSRKSWEELWEDSTRLIQERRLSEVRSYARQMEKIEGKNLQRKALVLTLLGAADLGDGNNRRAMKRWDEANDLAGEFVLPISTQFLAAQRASNVRLAAYVLDKMLRDFPEAVHEQDLRSLLPYLGIDDPDQSSVERQRVIALADMNYGRTNYEWLKVEAAEYLLSGPKPDKDRAIAFIHRLERAGMIQRVLMLRVFAPIWPELEAYYDGQMDSIWENELAGLAQRENRSSSDLTFHIGYLLAGRRYEAALEKTQKIVPPLENLGAVADEDLAWNINHQAIALSELGRAREADALLTALVDSNLGADGKDWLPYFAINHIELLLNDGQIERAKARLSMADSALLMGGRDSEMQLVLRQRYCVLSLLREGTEILDRIRSQLLNSRSSGLITTAEGLACAGDEQIAVGVMIEALSNANEQMSAIEHLQAVTLRFDDPSRWRPMLYILRRNSALEEAFQEVARDLPPRFMMDYQSRQIQ